GALPNWLPEIVRVFLPSNATESMLGASRVKLAVGAAAPSDVITSTGPLAPLSILALNVVFVADRIQAGIFPIKTSVARDMLAPLIVISVPALPDIGEKSVTVTTGRDGLGSFFTGVLYSAILPAPSKAVAVMV